jgi:leukotriene-A4 hydrolase
MMAAVEELYGPYRWERFDMLVLPPSFPWGGMENPRLTFLTPALLAGDRSQVNVIGHELAHSWSGNLVTNATWNDMWLNEGFTTYLEHRIQEALYGVEAAAMHWELGRQDLLRECPELADHGLRMDLTGRDPDLAASAIAYKKGSLFLRLLEETVGRERLDAFLRGYFDTHAFQSMDTSRFLDHLHAELLEPARVDPATLHLDDWLGGPCFPDNAPMIRSDAFTRVDAQIQRLKKDEPAAALETDGWLTQQWVHFLRHLPRDLGSPRLRELDEAFGFSDSGNSVVLTDWFVLAIESGHLFSDARVDAALERFLVGLGRRLHLLPIYGALTKTLEGTARAREIYARARSGYHSIAVGSLDPIVGWGED